MTNAGRNYPSRIFVDKRGEDMRLDKYLKVSRIIKRRTVANEACSGGRVSVNGKVAKASQDIKVGDVIEVAFGNSNLKAEVLSVKDNVRKDDAQTMFKLL